MKVFKGIMTTLYNKGNYVYIILSLTVSVVQKACGKLLLSIYVYDFFHFILSYVSQYVVPSVDYQDFRGKSN